VSRYRRWNELLELLAADGQLQVERAAQVLGVSAATVRRDFDELARHIKIVATGGAARPQSYELTGPLATGILDQVILDIAFLGVDRIDADAGVKVVTA